MHFSKLKDDGKEHDIDETDLQSQIIQKRKTDKMDKNHRIQYVATGMQGWRPYQEDTSVAQLDIGDGNSFFGVFDGHGGAEVSKFC